MRWVLGVSLRRPWETAYPSHMPNPAAYDHTLTEILTEEFFRARVKNLLRRQGKLLQLHDITQALGVGEVQAHEYLKDMGYEAQIAISFVNRTRFYGLPWPGIIPFSVFRFLFSVNKIFNIHKLATDNKLLS